MSRIGKKPVALPPKVSVTVDGRSVRVKGPLGTLSRDLPAFTELEMADQEITVKRLAESRHARANHGLARSLIQNMVTGVSSGYKRVLVIEGVGYRAEESGGGLTLNVGYSQPVPFVLPEGIRAELADRGARITLSGIDKELLGRISAKIRAVRPPEPYKGKGIRYEGERIRRKVGKAGVG